MGDYALGVEGHSHGSDPVRGCRKVLRADELDRYRAAAHRLLGLALCQQPVAFLRIGARRFGARSEFQTHAGT